MKLGKARLAALKDLTLLDYAHIASIGAAGAITDIIARAHLATTSETFIILTTILGILGVFNQTASPQPPAADQAVPPQVPPAS
jgi:multisubunit Na+/H+ antiporter MnhG subunit